MKKYFLLLSFFLTAELYAQQLPVYSHLVANRFLINPATVGSVKQPSIDLLFRQQWVGLAATPKDGLVSFQLFIPKYRVGVGAAIYSDKTATLNRNTLNLAYDYRLRLNSKLNLSLGMNIMATQFGINTGNIASALNYDDPILSKNKTSFIADAGAGAFLFNNKWNIGISSLQLAQSKIANLDITLEDSKNYRHYYLVGGYNMDISYNLSLRNMFMIRSTFHSPIIGEYIGQLRYNDLFWIQAGFRSQKTALAGFGFSLKKSLKIGYLYESKLLLGNAVPGASHEIYMSYVFTNVHYAKPTSKVSSEQQLENSGGVAEGKISKQQLQDKKKQEASVAKAKKAADQQAKKAAQKATTTASLTPTVPDATETKAQRKQREKAASKAKLEEATKQKAIEAAKKADQKKVDQAANQPPEILTGGTAEPSIPAETKAQKKARTQAEAKLKKEQDAELAKAKKEQAIVNKALEESNKAELKKAQEEAIKAALEERKEGQSTAVGETKEQKKAKEKEAKTAKQAAEKAQKEAAKKAKEQPKSEIKKEIKPAQKVVEDEEDK